MADKRISELTTATSITLNDLIVLINNSQTRKTTISALLSFIDSQQQFANLDTSGKIPLSQIPASILGAANYQSAWDAAINQPEIPLADNSNKGWYYVVSNAGTTTINGINDWKLGDWIISNGTAWQKIDNTDALLSWNGRTGAVVPMAGDYTTDTVAEGTNKYYTAARVLSELLTGLNNQNTAINSSDSILVALGKAQGQIDARESISSKGIANGYASLDTSGKHPKSQMNKGEVAQYLNVTTNTAPAVTTESIFNSIEIQPGAIAAGDQLNISIWFGATSGTNNKTLRLYFNTSNSLSGATLIATLSVTTNSSSANFSRTCSIVTNTTMKTGSAGATSTATGAVTTVLDPGITIPPVSSGFWIILTGQKAVAADTLRIDRIAVSTLYA
jgi:hypothetical protein